MTFHAKELEAWLVERLAALRDIDGKNIDPRERFNRYGLDSLGAAKLIADLSATLGRPLSPTLVWEYPTLSALAEHLAGRDDALPGEAATVTGAAPALRDPAEPIAIVGMACRFPKAPNLDAFWELLSRGVDAVVEAPESRWDADALFDADTSAPGKLNTRWGGFLDHVDLFEPQFFGISPREAIQMDPQQRLVLELAWEALEDAGIPAPGLAESRTGVFVGALFTDYALLKDRAGADAITAHSSTGGAACIIANRVSYALGLQGPSLTVDTACSSSLVAVHLACQSLRSGESDVALAGGVNLMLVPETTIGFTKLGAMSPDGKSRAFDHRANGYVRSEGAGVVTLKRLSDALRDGDRVYAVVRGSAVNNDGASNGLTAPNPKAQQAVLRDACAAAGLAPGDVHYVEAHGTGTPLGDPIEAGGLGAVYGAAHPAERPLLIGSAKTNVGHLEAAAGIVGLVKVALAMKNDLLPPSLHFEAPNPRIDFQALHLQVVKELQTWPAPEGAPRRAGVSSFGYGGTNGHVILESLPAPLRPFAASAEARVEARRAAWVFSGQGSQWVGMGRRLVLSEPAFRAALGRCDRALLPLLGWSVFEEILRGAPRATPDRIDVMWPTLFAFQVSLAALLRSLGVAPAAVIGHSIGEVAAAHVAGALSLEDAARVIAGQAKLVQRTVGTGSMLLAAVGWDEAGELAAPFDGRVTCAIAASPTATVLAGEPEALDALQASLAARGVFVRPVNTSAPVHGPGMAFLGEELPPLLAGLRPAPAQVPIFSAMTGEPIRGEDLDVAYWARQLREPVRFAHGIARLLADGYEVLVEVSPHPIVKQSVEETARHHGLGKSVTVAATLFRGEEESRALGEVLGVLAPRGAPLEEPSEARFRVLPLSARVEEATREAAARMIDLIERPDAPSLDDVHYTAGVRRAHHRARAAVVARGRDDLLEGLRALAEGREHDAVKTGAVPVSGAPKVVFVFPGQGSQWLGMGRQLLAEEPAFRAAMEACDAAIAKESGFSVLAEIAADEARSRLAEIDVVQPLLFAVEVALAALWRSWGVEPDCVIGHSMGEVAAAQVAGILSLEDAAKVICRRSRLLRRVSGKGAMGLVELTLPDAEAALSGYEDRLSVAVSNGPRSTVLSGDPTALEAVLATLEKKGVFCRRVKVDVASHSPQVDPLLSDLHAALSDLRPREARVAMQSTVTGAPVAGADLDAGYWVKNLREPVLFSVVTQQLVKDGHGLFVEMSPHPILLPAVEENLREAKRGGVAIASVRRSSDEQRAMREAAATLYAHGGTVDFRRLCAEEGRCVALPGYPWQRERFWLDDAGAGAARGARPGRASQGGHPLLGAPLVSSLHADDHLWEQWVSVGDLPYLADHCVRGEVVFPGTGYVEMALAAATELFGAEGFVLEDVAFEWMLAGGAPQRVQASIVNERDHALFSVSSRDEATGAWTRHAVARVRGAMEESEDGWDPPRSLRERCPSEVNQAAHYERMTARQLEYGPAFQGVERIWAGTGEALARIRLPEAAGDATSYRVHPALLDACLQVAAALFGEAPNDTFVPVQIDRVRLRGRPPREAWLKVSVADAAPSVGVPPVMNLTMVNESGWPLVEIKGLRWARLASAGAPDPFAGCAYTVAWQRKELPEDAAPSVPTSLRQAPWVLFVDEGGTGAAVARQLRAQGHACLEVVPGARFERRSASRYTIDPSKFEDYQRFFREVVSGDRPCQGVAHFWSLDAAPVGDTTAETLLGDVRRGPLSALHVVQELVWRASRDTPRLVLVTRGAQAAGEDASVASVAQAPVWGLGRTIAMEQPDLACKRVDLAPGRGQDEVAKLIRELLSSDGEDQVAFRREGRLVARLERGDVPPAEPPALSGDATYLITGGLGGLGLSVAQWMVSRGARHLLLLGRSDPNETARPAIEAMEASGVRVRTWQADVARASDVAGAVVYVEENMPPLRGVVHAAGVLEDRTLQEMSEEQFSRPVRPKILGAWNLHTATRGLALDFFVMYSSASGLLGSPGQGNYAAANAFLDALAHVRRAEGLPATSIQWGTFSEVGLAAAQENRGERLAHRGIDSFTPDEGTEMLSRLLVQPYTEIGILRMSVRQWLEFYPRAASAPFLSDLREAEGRASVRGAGGGQLRDALEDLPEPERRHALERHVLECLGRVLRLAPDRIDPHAPFRGYGMDSLMSLEIRNRLEPTLGLKLSAALLYTYPTTAALVDYLLTEMHLEAAPAEADGARVEDGHEAMQLSEEAAVAMLQEKLMDLEDYLK